MAQCVARRVPYAAVHMVAVSRVIPRVILVFLSFLISLVSRVIRVIHVFLVWSHVIPEHNWMK